MVVEEYLEGEEATVLALTDGETILPSSLPRTTSAFWTGTRAP